LNGIRDEYDEITYLVDDWEPMTFLIYKAEPQRVVDEHGLVICEEGGRPCLDDYI